MDIYVVIFILIFLPSAYTTISMGQESALKSRKTAWDSSPNASPNYRSVHTLWVCAFALSDTLCVGILLYTFSLILELIWSGCAHFSRSRFGIGLLLLVSLTYIFSSWHLLLSISFFLSLPFSASSTSAPIFLLLSFKKKLLGPFSHVLAQVKAPSYIPELPDNATASRKSGRRVDAVPDLSLRSLTINRGSSRSVIINEVKVGAEEVLMSDHRAAALHYTLFTTSFAECGYSCRGHSKGHPK